MEMTIDEIIETLEDMKIKIPVPKAAVMQNKKNEALDYALSSLKTDKAYKLMHEGIEVFTKEEVIMMFRDLQSEISSMFPHSTQNDYWDGYDSCREDVVKRVLQTKINNLGR